MIHFNLDTDKELKRRLALLGFKKKGHFFERVYNDTKQSLGFGHSTYGLKDTRFYSLSFYIECIPIIELKKKLDVSVSPIGNNIGYLMPENSYKEWMLRKSDSEEYMSELIESILESIEKYALPYMNSLSTMSELCCEIELRNVVLMRLDNLKWRILLYYIMGDINMLNNTINNADIGLHEKDVILYKKFIEKCLSLPNFELMIQGTLGDHGTVPL